MSDTRSTLVRLVKKDAAYLRVRAAACWALVASLWVWPSMDRLAELAPLHLGLGLFVPLFVLGGLLQQDPALGSTSFWITRPISPGLLLASKALVALGWVILPVAFLQTAPLVSRGLDLRPSDYVFVFASRLGYVLLGTGLVVTAAALTRRLTETAVLAAGLFVAFLMVAAVFTRVVPEAFGVDRTSYGMVLPAMLVLQTGIFLAVLYRTRRLPPALVVLALGGLVVLGLGRTWRWELWRSLAGPTSAAARPHRSDWPVRVQVLEQGPYWRVEGDVRLADVRATVQGLPEGLSLMQAGYSVRLRRGADDAGSTYRFTTSDPRPSAQRSPWWRDDARPALPDPWRAALGCNDSSIGTVEVFRKHLAGRSWSLDAPYSLSGTLHFQVVRSSVVRSASVDGGSLPFPGGRFTARREDKGGETRVVIRAETVSLFPFVLPWRSAMRDERLSPGLFDPATRQCLAPSSILTSGRSNLVGTPFLPLQFSETRYSGWLPAGNTDAEFVPETAQFMVVKTEPVGILDVPFEIAVPGKRS